jgi:hypothetical protein
MLLLIQTNVHAALAELRTAHGDQRAVAAALAQLEQLLHSDEWHNDAIGELLTNVQALGIDAPLLDLEYYYSMNLRMNSSSSCNNNNDSNSSSSARGQSHSAMPHQSSLSAEFEAAVAAATVEAQSRGRLGRRIVGGSIRPTILPSTCFQVVDYKVKVSHLLYCIPCVAHTDTTAHASRCL